MGPNNQDRRFKSLPPAESLPRNEPLGGYIFVCNNDTMEDDLRRRLFGLPQRYRDSVRAIQPGLPLFLYNYTTHQLHGVYEATSFGGSNLDPNAWEDKKTKGESRFPAQVRIKVRKQCSPLDEDHFRPILHHYDGPKFRLQLSVQETLNLLDLFDAVTSSAPTTPTAAGGTPPATSPSPIPPPANRAVYNGLSLVKNESRIMGPFPFSGSPPATSRGPFANVTFGRVTAADVTFGDVAFANVSYPESPPGPYFPFYGESYPPANGKLYGAGSAMDVNYARSFPPGVSTGQKSFEMASYARVMRPLSMV
ncbi:hypothetical protein KFL_000600340 [Klebsormidium nitens]|uniref:DCD domain-containing protein n=1 Tax=Klebsormidium nitens TaxID=105231 RepID=A0A1Y1HW27_KLENI|nr:hypothetical protein KFL_000600340 [Klebsormidium nitens]|eukprot:GAQ80717.1 hypothetical protein KFL_000600340 [Klebsormidium nitens]